MRRLLPTLVLPAMAASPVAMGETAFPYTSVGIAMSHVELDDELDEGFGSVDSITTYGLRGQYQMDNRSYLHAEFFEGSERDDQTEFDITGLSFGIGYPIQIHERADLFLQADVQYEQNDVEIGPFFEDDGDDIGIGYTAGARIWAAPGRLELNPFISDNTVDVEIGDDEDDDEGMTYGINARAWLTSNHTLSLSLATVEDGPDIIGIAYDLYLW